MVKVVDNGLEVLTERKEWILDLTVFFMVGNAVKMQDITVDVLGKTNDEVVASVMEENDLDPKIYRPIFLSLPTTQRIERQRVIILKREYKIVHKFESTWIYNKRYKLNIPMSLFMAQISNIDFFEPNKCKKYSVEIVINNSPVAVADVSAPKNATTAQVVLQCLLERKVTDIMFVTVYEKYVPENRWMVARNVSVFANTDIKYRVCIYQRKDSMTAKVPSTKSTVVFALDIYDHKGIYHRTVLDIMVERAVTTKNLIPLASSEPFINFETLQPVSGRKQTYRVNEHKLEPEHNVFHCTVLFEQNVNRAQTVSFSGSSYLTFEEFVRRVGECVNLDPDLMTRLPYTILRPNFDIRESLSYGCVVVDHKNVDPDPKYRYIFCANTGVRDHVIHYVNRLLTHKPGC